MLHDYGYVENAIKNIREVAEKQADNIHALRGAHGHRFADKCP